MLKFNNLVSEAKTQLDSQISSNELRLSTVEDLAAQLQVQIDAIKAQTNSEISLAQLDLNTQDIAYLKMMLGISEDSASGDISISGKLKASIVEAGKLVVIVNDVDAKTIGDGSILAIKKDEDANGQDDDTKSDGKTFFVKTKAANVSSKVFITPKVALDQGIAVTEVKFGEGFTVSVKNPVTEDVLFDWVIMEEKL